MARRTSAILRLLRIICPLAGSRQGFTRCNARGPQQLARIFFSISLAKYRIAGHQQVRARFHYLDDGIFGHAAIDFHAIV